MAAVGGAVRNSSGHWRVECRQVEDRMLMINDYNNNVYQLELSYYRLEMVPGYRLSHEDCEVPPPRITYHAEYHAAGVRLHGRPPAAARHHPGQHRGLRRAAVPRPARPRHTGHT